MKNKTFSPAEMLNGLKIRWRLHGNDPTEPTCRQRGIYVYEELQRIGIDADKWDGGTADIIVLQYNMERLVDAKQQSPVVIADVNDMVFANHHAYHDSMISGFTQVDAVVAGSVRIGQHLSKLHPMVRLIEEAVDPKYLEIKKQKHSGINVIWAGMHDNLRYVEEIDNVLEELSNKYDFLVHFICPLLDGEGRSNQNKVSKKPYCAMYHEWTMQTLLQQMSLADIGIAPLFFNEWTACKSSNKALSFMAAGIPTVVSDVPSYRRITNNGVNGLLSFTEEDWYSNIEALLQDVSFRSRIAVAGRETALDYTIDKIALQWVELFREVRST